MSVSRRTSRLPTARSAPKARTPLTMRSSALLRSLLGLAAFAFVFASLPDTSPAPVEEELARLHWERLHSEEGSARSAKLDRKIKRLEDWEEGTPMPEHPDLFAQALYDMKVPADREYPEYRPGYRLREMASARMNSVASKSPLPWVERGPGNVAGRCRGLLVDPIDPSGNTWFVGSVGGGVWWTGDAGANWIQLTTDPQSYATSTLAQNGDVIYAGTGESFFNIDTMNGNGMLKSIDRGLSWAPLASTLDDSGFNNIARIVVDPDDPDVVLVAANLGRYKLEDLSFTRIFKSIDGGASWTVVFISGATGSFDRVNKVQDLKANPENFNTIYAAMDEGGIFKSTNAGDTWTASNNGINDFSGRFEIAISPVDTNRIYAAAEGLSGISKLWVSYDGGANWTGTVEAVGEEPKWLGAQGWYDNTILCHPTDPDIVYVGGIQLWKIEMVSANQRESVRLNQGGVHVDHHNLVLLPGDGGTPWRLLNANDGGVAVSSDMDNGWSMPILGLNTTQFYGIDKKPGASAYVGGMQDNSTWRSPEDTDELDPWIFQIGGDGYETSWHFNDPSKIIGGYQYNGLMRSLDGGESWSGATNGLLDTGSGAAPFLTKIAKSNDAPELLYAVGISGVWRSADFGANWNLSTVNGLDWAFSSFVDVKISRANSQVVWAGASMLESGVGAIHLSTDNGLSFDPVPNYTDATMGGISGMSTHPTDDQTAYVLFSFSGRPKILRTVDQGSSWQDITGFAGGAPSTNGFPDVAVYDLLVHPHDTNTLWAGTEIGLFESTDNGVSWHLADNGLPNVGIWAMTHVEDEIVLATHGLGVWSVSIPAMTAGQTYNPLIDALHQIPSGNLIVGANLRSAYDSTQVWVDGAIAVTFPANAAGDHPSTELPVLSDGTVQVQLKSFKDSVEYPSVVREQEVFVLAEAQFSYVTDFNGGNGDFVGASFSVMNWSGFDDEAIHSPHSYPDGFNESYTLTVPIRIAQANAYVEFDEVVIVEPGESGSEFGDFGFWDYVIVEGTADGITWSPLLDGYDSREDVDWLSQYNSGQPGNKDLYRHRIVDLHDTFAWGDTILVRFRLFTDSAVVGWGWAIDNLSIQNGSPTNTDGAPQLRFTLGQNFPNPFNPSTQIRYELPRGTRVSLKIYDQRGRLVRTLVETEETAGRKLVTWDGRSQNGARVASGIYLYRLVAGETVAQRKMTLVK